MYRFGFIILFILQVCLGHKLHACSCMGKSNFKESIKNTDAIFIGTVLNAESIRLIEKIARELYPNDTASQNNYSGNMNVIRYDVLVENIYKGKITRDTIFVYSGTGSGDCGIEFSIGEKYIVFGEKETYFGQINNTLKFPKGKNIFWTDICSPTTLYNETEIAYIEQYAKKRKMKRALK